MILTVVNHERFVSVDAEGYEILKEARLTFRKGRIFASIDGAAAEDATKVLTGRKMLFKNEDPFDLRQANLRKVLRGKKTSRFRGVTWDGERKKWAVCFSEGGKFVRLGRYDTEDEAKNAYVTYKLGKMNERRA
jgi:hypothetical protein